MLMNIIVNEWEYWVIVGIGIMAVMGIVFIYVWDIVSNNEEDDTDMGGIYEDDIQNNLDMVDDKDEDP